jgi:hypothetical protein
MRSTIALCQAVQATVEQRRVELQNRYSDKHLPTEAGEYPLNVSDPAGAFFLPKQPPLKISPERARELYAIRSSRVRWAT